MTSTSILPNSYHLLGAAQLHVKFERDIGKVLQLTWKGLKRKPTISEGKAHLYPFEFCSSGHIRLLGAIVNKEG